MVVNQPFWGLPILRTPNILLNYPSRWTSVEHSGGVHLGINEERLIAQLGSVIPCCAIVRIRTRSTLAPSWTTPQRRWRFARGANHENMPCPEHWQFCLKRIQTYEYMYTYVFAYACTYLVGLSFHDVIPLGSYTLELYQWLVIWVRQSDKRPAASSPLVGVTSESGPLMCKTLTADSLAGIPPRTPEQLALTATQIQPRILWGH